MDFLPDYFLQQKMRVQNKFQSKSIIKNATHLFQNVALKPQQKQVNATLRVLLQTLLLCQVLLIWQYQVQVPQPSKVVLFQVLQLLQVNTFHKLK